MHRCVCKTLTPRKSPCDKRICPSRLLVALEPHLELLPEHHLSIRRFHTAAFHMTVSYGGLSYGGLSYDGFIRRLHTTASYVFRQTRTSEATKITAARGRSRETDLTRREAWSENGIEGNMNMNYPGCALVYPSLICSRVEICIVGSKARSVA